VGGEGREGKSCIGRTRSCAEGDRWDVRCAVQAEQGRGGLGAGKARTVEKSGRGVGAGGYPASRARVVRGGWSRRFVATCRRGEEGDNLVRARGGSAPRHGGGLARFEGGG